MAYSFDEQLRVGRKWERFLDEVFSPWYEITPATAEEERRGIDRHYVTRKTGRRLTIQYKADKTAARTGNAFVETVSVDRTGKPGWAYSCEADYLIYYVVDYLIYYVVDTGPAYVLKPGDIRIRLPAWLERYPERRIPNRDYHTVGLLVPLDEFERLAVVVEAT